MITKIEEGNALIANFIEYMDKYNNVCKYSKSWFDELKYHSSWDWLIPVIDKITSMNEYSKFKDYTSNMVSEGGIYINTRFIESTWEETAEFIKFYNNNYENEKS